MKYLILILLINLNTIVLSQNTFTYIYSTPKDEYVLDAIEDEFGNFYLAGSSFNPYSDHTKGFVIKIDSYGEFVSEKVYTARCGTFIAYCKISSRLCSSGMVMKSG